LAWIDDGEHVTETPVTVDGAELTVTVADPNLEVSCDAVAVIVAVPVELGVNTPPLLTVPMVEGLTDQVTVELKVPVPVTVGVQVEVSLV